MAAIDFRRFPSASEVYLCTDRGYFPVLTDLGGGEVLAVIRAGAGHVGITGRLESLRSTDGGRTWEAPVVIVDSDADDRNPAVGVAPDGTVVLAYHTQGSYGEDGTWAPELRRVEMRVTRSRDAGRSWEGSVPLGFPAMRKHSAYGRIVNLPGGTMLLPLYGSDIRTAEKKGDCACILRSDDSGGTWDRPSLIAEGHNETALLLTSAGVLLAAMRSADRGGLISVSRSTDGGYTWDAPSEVTAGREHPADLTLLSNDWILMVYGVRHEPFGVQARVSKDAGRTWSGPLVVCDDLGDSDLGYPSTVRLGDRLVTAYYCAPRVWNAPEDPGEGAFARALLYSEVDLIDALNRDTI
ncbi:MAG: sialidase family protein [Gemmatimonadota bacterium]|nr:sialidase family protein [Gemmatimonadota bacterium]